MPNTPKLKVIIVRSITERDIENSPHKLGDLSLSNSCGGDGSGEEKARRHS